MKEKMLGVIWNNCHRTSQCFLSKQTFRNICIGVNQQISSYVQRLYMTYPKALVNSLNAEVGTVNYIENRWTFTDISLTHMWFYDIITSHFICFFSLLFFTYLWRRNNKYTVAHHVVAPREVIETPLAAIL